MHRSRRRIAFSLLPTLASLLCAATARAQTQPATDRAPLTEHDAVAQTIAFNERFAVEAYKTAGRRDAKWDADALAFLAAQARDGVTDRSDVFYQPDAPMPLPDRVALGRRARDAGCDDAIVLYFFGQALDANGEGPGAARAFEQSRDAFARGTTPYPKLYEMLAFLADWRGSRRENTDERRGQFFAMLRAALADRATLPAYRRAVWTLGSPILADGDQAHMLRVGNAIDDLTDADPWLYGTLMGRVEINRAWQARGDGWASTVTDAGWKEFRRHLELATAHFQRAIAADDVEPQPFEQMITVAMAESSGQERAWFDNAVARQCDLSVAFANYRYALLPRWGGTHIQIYQLGIEALDTGLFDTRMPAMLLDAISAIETDQERPLDERQKNRVYPEVVRCLDGYIANNPRLAVQRWARSARAAWAARLGKWDEAQPQFAALRDAKLEPRDDVFADANLDAGRVAAQAAIFTGPHADEAHAAVNDVRRIDALIAKLDAGDPAVEWLRDRRATATLRDALAAGEWTPVPLELAANWRVDSGEWTVDGDALVGKAGGRAAATRLALRAARSLRGPAHRHRRRQGRAGGRRHLLDAEAADRRDALRRQGKRLPRPLLHLRKFSDDPRRRGHDLASRPRRRRHGQRARRRRHGGRDPRLRPTADGPAIARPARADLERRDVAIRET